MNRLLKGNVGLISFLVFLLAFFLLPPIAVGYGSSFGNATIVTDGTDAQSLLNPDFNAYYKINRSSGGYLQVTTDCATTDLVITLYDPDENEHATSGLGSTDSKSCGCDCDESGYWYIHIVKYVGGEHNFTLTISSSAPIPGFDLPLVFFSFLILIGLIFTYKYRKQILD